MSAQLRRIKRDDFWFSTFAPFFRSFPEKTRGICRLVFASENKVAILLVIRDRKLVAETFYLSLQVSPINNYQNVSFMNLV